MNWSSWKCCWEFPIVVSADHSAAGDIDYQSTAGSGCTKGTDHDSTDWVVLGTSVGNLAKGWCAYEYYFQRPIPEASSSWPPSLCACCQ